MMCLSVDVRARECNPQWVLEEFLERSPIRIGERKEGSGYEGSNREKGSGVRSRRGKPVGENLEPTPDQ
jgi:hypothetical protein